MSGGLEDEVYKTMGMVWRILSPAGKMAGKAIYSSLTKESEAYEVDPIKSNNPSKVNLSRNPSGFIFGKLNGNFIEKKTNQDGHIAVIGGAGSGKTSCIAIPSLLSWIGRTFAIDIKGDLYKKTHHSRPNTKVFNPLDKNACGYDPYETIICSDNEVQDMREMALILAPLNENEKDPFWINSEQNLLTASIIHFYCLQYTFIETIEAIVSTPIEELINDLVNSEIKEARIYSNQFNSMDSKTLSGIYAGLCNKIMVFATDEDVRNSLTKDFTIQPDDIECGMDIYLCIKSGTYQSTSPHEKRKIKPEDFATLDYIVLQTPDGVMKADKAPYYGK